MPASTSSNSSVSGRLGQDEAQRQHGPRQLAAGRHLGQRAAAGSPGLAASRNATSRPSGPSDTRPRPAPFGMASSPRCACTAAASSGAAARRAAARPRSRGLGLGGQRAAPARPRARPPRSSCAVQLGEPGVGLRRGRRSRRPACRRTSGAARAGGAGGRRTSSRRLGSSSSASPARSAARRRRRPARRTSATQARRAVGRNGPRPASTPTAAAAAHRGAPSSPRASSALQRRLAVGHGRRPARPPRPRGARPRPDPARSAAASARRPGSGAGRSRGPAACGVAAQRGEGGVEVGGGAGARRRAAPRSTPAKWSRAARWVAPASRLWWACWPWRSTSSRAVLGQLGHRGQPAVDVGAASGRPPARPGAAPPRRRRATKRPSTHASAAPAAHERGVGPPADEEVDGLDEEGLAGAGLAGDGGQPRTEQRGGPRRSPRGRATTQLGQHQRSARPNLALRIWWKRRGPKRTKRAGLGGGPEADRAALRQRRAPAARRR